MAAAANQIPGEPSDMPDESGPRSTSSAMPDLSSNQVPRLRARVHQVLSPEECQKIRVEDLNFRPLEEHDYKEMIDLHTEWFPVTYDEAFFKNSVAGEFFTLVATYTKSSPSQPKEEREESILGMITMSTSCSFHSEDIGIVLGSDCDGLCRQPPGSIANPHGRLAYILTLGVVDGFRRRGLAKELLERSVQHADRHMPLVEAVYLHVVSYNAPAIRLYESARFLQISRFDSFYELHGTRYDSLLYALYLHNGRPAWRVRLRSFWSQGWV